MSNTNSDVSRGHEHLPARTRLLGGVALLAAAASIAYYAWPQHRQQEDVAQVTRDTYVVPDELPAVKIRSPVAAPVAPALPPAATEAAPPVTTTTAAAAPTSEFGFWSDKAAMDAAAQKVAQARLERQLSRERLTAEKRASNPDVGRPSPSDYAQRMQTTQFANSRPTPPNIPPMYTIRKGTVFPCTVDQPIASDLPGPVRCTVDYPGVWSMDGTTMLLPPGTQVNGSIERGLSVGEQRLFMVWTDALTPAPDFRVIPLDAVAADPLGQSGVPGDINTHLWARAKGALLLSLVDIASSAASSAASSGRGNTILNLGSIGNTASSLGQMAFAHDNNIQPTLWRGPGYPMSVYVNHYIDLSAYYENRVRR